MYWIHPDHLGSSSVLTNRNGEISNWYEYMSFGEPLMELTTDQYNNPYKYNGKETDLQTGLHYYGARYYDSNRSFWLSVDPLVEKTMSPYSYTYNNPIRSIDPDGRSPFDIIIIGPNGAFKAGKEMLYKTAAGKALWDKYGTSKTDDIYIGFSSLSKNSTKSETTLAFTMYDVFNTYSSTIISKSIAGIVSINSNVKGTLLGDSFLPFDGIDVTRSNGKRTHFITFNDNYFSEANNKYYASWKYVYAETIYHEIYSHIDQHNNASAIGQYLRQFLGMKISNTEIEHNIYGSDTGNSIKKYAKPKDDFEEINSQLYDNMIKEFSKKK